MIVGVPRESYPEERRVAVVPAVVPILKAAGLTTLVERGAGAAAGFPDEAYRERGAELAASRGEAFARADVVCQVLGHGANDRTGRADLPLFRPGQVLVAFLRSIASPETVQELAASGVTAFALELLPRITRAQAMDALSAMATVAGYKAVLLAAASLPRMFPLLMTAAGTVTPARVLVIGAGVAGLQAIATARRMGAVVAAYDIRPATREEVESLGARFVSLALEARDAADPQGYARPQDEAVYRRQQELLTRAVGDSDVVITTAQVPGRRAPVLLTADMVRAMAPGSVVVDLAAEQGGNCALTRPHETVVAHGVTIIGPVNLASTVPYHASQMYARALAAFLTHLLGDGQVRLDPEDALTRETLVTHGGEVVHPRVREALGLGPSPRPS
jgi:NAD(P) transhydrogenase subunit alpha